LLGYLALLHARYTGWLAQVRQLLT
jgi:hypothetical protein